MPLISVDLLAPHRHFVALNVPAFADGEAVLLAIDTKDSTVKALTMDTANDLWQSGLLRGWTPS